MEDKIRQKIYLAALLHDIGKFYQRADNKKANGEFEFLRQEFWNKPEAYCPVYKSNYSHKHVIWTAQFIQDNTDIFNKLDVDGTDGKDSLTLLAALHHNPGSNIYAKIIQLADHYSSAIDRSDEEFNLEDDITDNKWDNFKKRRMVSVFEGIQKEAYDKKNIDDYSYFFDVNKLELSNDFFPKKNTELTKYPNYKELWIAFETDFKNIPITSFDIFAESLLALLHKYTVTVPSSTQHLPDVSLFDHAKTTAAFALAIYDFYTENKKLPSKEDKIINLIGADISGIQKFIYDIVSKNAAKNLKGRSFYLQLMTDSILRYILKELKLYSANIVYSSGGGFYILAPDTKDFDNKLNIIEKHISEKLLEKHKTGLFVAISSIKFSHTDLLPKEKNKIGDKWGELIQKLNEKKRQRYSDKLLENYPNFFEAIEQGGENKDNRDSITGEELEEKERTNLDDKKTVVSKDTKEQIQLGKELKNAKYWIISPTESKKLDKIHCFEPLDLGFRHYFLKEIPKSIPDNSIVLSINETDFTPMHSNAKYAVGFTFYGGNDYPEDKDGSPKFFDDLVGKGDFKRLGVLRMDVDNLGQIFINGLAENKRTFSRYSTLSRNLDYFFTGYLNTIQQQDKYKDLTYILYSGGDDLFILGKWDLLIEMAKEIQEKFTEWTCKNENISLSGGISLVTPKFPILKAANIAASEETNAKEYKNKHSGNEKNAFSLWNYALSWKEGYEFDIVLDLKKKIIKLINDDKLDKSFLGKISAFNEQRNFALNRKKEIDKGIDKPNINESWQWQMAYHLKRFMSGKSENIKTFIGEVQKDVFANGIENGNKNNTNYHYIELLNIASRWAELELRTNKNK